MSSNKKSTDNVTPCSLPPGDLLTLLIARLDDLLQPQPSGKLK